MPRLISPTLASTLESLRGTSIVAGQSSPASSVTFNSINPETGDSLPIQFSAASNQDLDHATAFAWEAFYDLDQRPPTQRAAFLALAAEKIAALGESILEVASAETGLAIARLASERDRTVFTLQMFAELVQAGEWMRSTIDGPSRPGAPAFHQMLRPLGPAAVFGAGNFPLAYGVAGGDTASALAAGCPVVVKGHPSHPATGELVARAVTEAVKESGLHAGTFSYLQAGGEREMTIGSALVGHPCIRAVGFTGSVGGGMAIAALAAKRPDPIPVFAEMGSVNPVFVMPVALELHGRSIADKLFASVTGSCGQMCTCPGLIFAIKGDEFETFSRTLASLFDTGQAQPMLSRRTRDTFAKRVGEAATVSGVEIRGGSPPQPVASSSAITGSPILLRTKAEVFEQSPTLREEIFGPATILVGCDSFDQMRSCAGLIRGSLTGSIFANAQDAPLAAAIVRVLEMRVGRIVFNGVPTGVEVRESMVHGGPSPATNQQHTTAVGPRAIERWCRPICYQGFPEPMLPAAFLHLGGGGGGATGGGA
ncbi:MAG: aldehyde dehydrogenase (NADP(+)) [Phycisphaerales bacterium]|nr:MAG: aldehyde dehydrogenase (NADP(+)) [Phycisphaerales bacterium]